MISLLICLFVLEFTLVFLIEDQEFWEYDPELGVRHIQNKSAVWCKTEFCHEFTTNSAGFIDTEFELGKNKDEKKIFIFGDSFMEGLQVNFNASTSALLEKKLNEKGIKLEVYNFGVSNYGPTEYLLSLEKYDSVYQPDLVIFAIFTQNDLSSINQGLEINPCRPFFELESSKLELVPPNCNPNLLENIIKKLKSGRYFYKAIKLAKEKVNQERNGMQLDYYFYQNKNDSKINGSYELLEKILREAQKISKEQGSKFLVVTLTNPIQLDQKSWIKMQKNYFSPLNVSGDLLLPEKRISSICQKNQLHCLELIYPFINYQKQTGKSLHFPLDGHWNEEGHKLAAEEIYQYILRNNLLNLN